MLLHVLYNICKASISHHILRANSRALFLQTLQYFLVVFAMRVEFRKTVFIHMVFFISKMLFQLSEKNIKAAAAAVHLAVMPYQALIQDIDQALMLFIDLCHAY